MRLLPRLKQQDKFILLLFGGCFWVVLEVLNALPWLLPSLGFIGLLIYFITNLLFQDSNKQINSDGYVFLVDKNEFEHRHIAKQILGRPLESNEVVHHINKMKKDNSIANLCVMDRTKHDRFHGYLRWCKKKNRYFSLKTQRRMLVDQYGGILLGDCKPIHETKYPHRPNYFDIEKKFDHQRALFDELRKARMRLARQRGIPAYAVFHNKILYQLAERKPDSKETMIESIGPDKFKLYGPYFLTVIRSYKNSS